MSFSLIDMLSKMGPTMATAEPLIRELPGRLEEWSKFLSRLDAQLIALENKLDAMDLKLDQIVALLVPERLPDDIVMRAMLDAPNDPRNKVPQPREKMSKPGVELPDDGYPLPRPSYIS